MEIFWAVLLFLAGLVLLKKGADWLVEGSSSLARRLGIPAIIVGLTIVAFGTSLPEFVVSLISALKGSSDLAIGNIIGSNIANIALILGISSLIMPILIKENTLIYETPFVLVSALLLLILSNDKNLFGADSFTLGRFDGAVFLLIFIFFIFYIYNSTKKASKPVKKEFESEFKKSSRLGTNIIYIIIGLACLFAGGKMLVSGAVSIAYSLGVSEKFIGLTIVAVGTSLPELFTTVVALTKKENDIALGNIIGSNIFNILFILGIVGIIKPVSVNPVMVYFDMIVMVILSSLLILFATTGRKINRPEGAFFLLSYIGYIIYLFILG